MGLTVTCHVNKLLCGPLTSLCVVALQAIVFMVGGGNYIEYQNLVDYSKVSSESRSHAVNCDVTHFEFFSDV